MSDKLITLDNLSYYNSKVKEVISNLSLTVQDDVDLHKNDTNNPHSVTKQQVGLSNVDNTSDIDKPISTATLSALDTITNLLASHTDDTSNPHNVTKLLVGLDLVDNTSDTDKPVSDAVKTLVLNTKTELNTAITNEVNRAKGQEDKIEAAVGLNADGTHKKTTGNYTSTATTIAGEISALDTQVKKNQDAITKLNADASTTGSVANSIKNAINTLDFADSAVSGLYVSSVSETDGKIRVSRRTIAASPLNDYSKGTSAASVTASDTINIAISKLENLIDSTKNSINNLDFADSAVSNLFVTSVSQTNGLIEVKRARPTASNISNTSIPSSDTQVGLSGTDVQTTIGNIATAIKNEEKARKGADNTLQSNINSIKGTIDNYTVNSKKISTNPVLNGTDIKATNYTKPSTTEAIAATDTINLALGKLEKKADDHIANKSNPHSVTKSQVGLGNVNNTSDANKPVSTAQAAAIKVVQDALNTHKADTTNPHKVTKALIGLGNVNNTSDANKPVSTLQATAIQDAKKAGVDAKTELDSYKTTNDAAVEAISTVLENHKADNDKKHIPSGGHERQILAWAEDGKAKWEDLANIFTELEELLAYGVEWDINVSDPHITRIGNMSLHKTLPIQSLLRGCIAQGDKVIYWLDEDNWKYKKGGNPNKGEPEQLTRLDGYDGTVRIYCPSFYIKSKLIGSKRQVWLSTVKIDDTWTYQHEILIDAYRSTVLNTVPENMGYLSTLSVNSAISVVNTATYCRGGGNRDSYDKYLIGEGSTPIDAFKTDLGKPRTNISRSTMRAYARAASSEMLSYDQYKNIFYWLYVVEYANFNCLEAYNEQLTSEGYHQGGMGPSITNVDSTKWNEYNGYYPITPCGYGNDLGNGTGLKTIVLPATSSKPESTHYMARWRGFDNPFGDIWINLDGIIIDADANNHPNNMNYVYTCQDASKYADTLNDSYVKVGEEIHQDGYTKSFDLGDAAHIIPHVMGGNNTKYICDYHWTGSKGKTLRTLIVGGRTDNGAYAGLGFFYSNDDVSNAWSGIGFRSVSGFVSFSSDK